MIAIDTPLTLTGSLLASLTRAAIARTAIARGHSLAGQWLGNQMGLSREEGMVLLTGLVVLGAYHLYGLKARLNRDEA